MHEETVPLITGVLVFCAICQWLAWRVKLPAILFLLLTGIVAGPVLGIIKPEQLLGELLFPFVSLSVAIILFEGSLTLRIREIKGLHIVVRNLVSTGMIVTWLVTTLATKFFTHCTWEIATLFGAIMVVTGPTVIAPILRTVRPVSSIANILKWESIVIDPIGASLAVLVFEFILLGGWQEGLSNTLITFIELIFIGSAIGAFAGHFFGLCLRYHFIPEFLHNLTALALVFCTFALANSLQPESGLVTVTVFGVWLANMKGVDLEHILAFKETLSILLISMLFIILAARLDFGNVQLLGWGALAVCAIIQFIARPLNILVSTFKFNLKWRECVFLAWIAPRGIVAAAISSLFSLKLLEYGYQDAAIIVPLTFTVIIFTVLLQSITALPLAKILKVNLPEPEGFLVVGGNSIARLISRQLLDLGYQVILADSSLEGVAQAKKENIPTYLGNPISEHALNYLDLSGIGKLLALSEHESENIAAAFHFRDDFGKKNIYTLLTTPHGRSNHKLRTMPQLRGKTLFGKNISYSHLEKMVGKGATIHSFEVQSDSKWKDLFGQNNKDKIPLLACDTKGKVHVFNNDQPPEPKDNWKILYLSRQKIEGESFSTDRST